MSPPRVDQLVPFRHPARKLKITRQQDLIFLGRKTLGTMIEFWQFQGGVTTAQRSRALAQLRAHSEEKPVLSGVRPRDYFRPHMKVAYVVTLQSHRRGAPPSVVYGNITHCGEDYRLTILLNKELANGSSIVTCKYADPRVLNIWDLTYLRTPPNIDFARVWLYAAGRNFTFDHEEFLQAITGR